MRGVLDPATPGALERFLLLYDERLLETTCPYAGTREVLEALSSRRPLAVLTNNPTAAAEKILEGLGLRVYFGAVAGGDTGDGRKPDPAGLRRLAAQAGVPVARTLLVGDSAVDLATARNADARICLGERHGGRPPGVSRLLPRHRRAARRRP